MLGSDVCRELASLALPFVGSDQEIDITRPAALRDFAHGREIRWIVNCAAYTAVDHAEEEPDRAFALNADGVGNVAEVAEQLGAGLIHLSTDYVFDGCGSSPYTEQHPAAPVSAYGRSKAAGEVLAMERCSRSYVLRTSWLYGPRGKNFVSTMLKLMQERDVVKVVDDQSGCPTYTADLARAIATIVQNRTDEHGIYHFANRGPTTWFEFAKEIYEQARRRGLLSRGCAIEPCATRDFATPAKRPAYSVLSTEKIRRVFGISIPTTPLPGIGATMRTRSAFMAIAMSSLSELILLSFTPGAGRNSKIVMTGPGRIAVTSPLTPKSASFASSTVASSCSSSSSTFAMSFSCESIRPR